MFFDVLNVLSSLPRFHIIASGTTIVSSSDSRNSEIWRFVPELSSDR
tara:strand:+ start:724 stop:864 length:141 start_codon:yes stop_codon:yes gene_type:complete